MIEVTAPAGALDKEKRDRLMKRLTDTLLKWEGADPGNIAAQAIAWAYYNEIPDGRFYAGGENPAGPRFRLDVTTPEGALNGETRAKLVEEIAGIVADETDGKGAGLNHWVLLHEIKEGGWGAAGRIFRRADIAAAVRGGLTSSQAR
jgi:phenylpyruvate tautomerase PptA (4-oxalocrotonate tautomerase family)